jgi:hypothetical protein
VKWLRVLPAQRLSIHGGQFGAAWLYLKPLRLDAASESGGTFARSRQLTFDQQRTARVRKLELELGYITTSTVGSGAAETGCW